MLTINIDNYLKYHLIKEFKNTILNESSGHPDNIDKWTDLLYDNIIPLLKIYKNNIGTIKKTLTINSNKSFFNKCIIDLFAIVNDKNDNCSLSPFGAYYPENSGIDNNGNYIIKISINLNGSLDWISNDLKPILAHELSHAYSDYKMNPNTLIEDKSFYSKINNKELHNLVSLFNEDKYLAHLYHIISFSLNSEISALQSEIYIEMSKKRELMTNFFNANDILINTKVYRTLKTIENRFNELKILNDLNEQNIILEYFNKIFYSNISNYNDMLTKLNVIWNKSRNKLISSACKTAQYVFELRNVHDYNNV